MKKRNVFVATCVTLMLVVGCSAQKGEVSKAFIYIYKRWGGIKL